VQAWLPQARGLSVHEALQWCRGGSRGAAGRARAGAAAPAVAGLREARAREGARLAGMLLRARGECANWPRRPRRCCPPWCSASRQRFLERWNEALQAAGAAQSVGRGAAGARAGRGGGLCHPHRRGRGTGAPGAHLDEIDRLLGAGGEIGKRLDFLIQELHREANTLGSKSAALELTRWRWR
jgi:uncharacterized protein YicC (UPF0701 family)